MYQQFILDASGDAKLGNQLGFPAGYVRFDNPTGAWLYERSLGQYIPPYKMNMILEFDANTQIANVETKTPLGAYSAPLPGQQALVVYFSADVLVSGGAGGGGQLPPEQNPAGFEEGPNPVLSSGDPSGYRSPVDLTRLTPLETTPGSDPKSRIQPAPLRRVEGALTGTPLEYLPGLPNAHATIEGLMILPHDEQGRVIYGDSFERTAPGDLWSLTDATLAATTTFAISGSSGGKLTATGPGDGFAERTFPLPRFGGCLGFEAIFGGAEGSPNGVYVRVTVIGPQATQVFGVRLDATQPSYWDNDANAWIPFQFPTALGSHAAMEAGDSREDVNALKVVWQNGLESLAYSHVVINGCTFNLWDLKKVTQTGVTEPVKLLVEIGAASSFANVDDVKITTNEAPNTPTTVTLGVPD